uniref:Uncharacterized protein n=1 Tax=Branchiostoma floridae TaxID=7739 RepID=C3YJM6_BRAFL|eukprot:XP_002603322.1 hypothetical protein BRAFLDRAFT_71384 [Branchiostoma floridae]
MTHFGMIEPNQRLGKEVGNTQKLTSHGHEPDEDADVSPGQYDLLALWAFVFLLLASPRGPQPDSKDQQKTKTQMAVNIPGIIAIVVFYLLILAVGMWAGRRGKKDENSTETKNAMLAGGKKYWHVQLTADTGR